MDTDRTQPPTGLGARLADRWESLPGQRQVGIAYPTIVVLLFVIHISLFHRLTVARCIGYAVFEGIVFTGLVMLATASERARKLRLAAALAEQEQSGSNGPAPV